MAPIVSGPPARSGRIILIVWLILCAAFSVRALLGLGTVPLIADTDDAMRLSVVRDFLSGQNWFDHLQHRMNAPYGAEIPWSRLIDLPLAGLMLVFSPLGGQWAAYCTAFVWPLLLLGPMLVLSARLGDLLVGPEGLLPMLILPAVAVPIISEFSPGRVDHHSVGILLTLGVLILILEARRRPMAGLWAGICAATALAIAVENLPVVGAAILAIGLLFVVEARMRVATRWFGIGLGLGSLFHLGLALPPAEWLGTACDGYSLSYAAGAALSGLGLFILSFLPAQAGWRLRLGGGVVAGALVLVVVGLAFPECLGGPYAGLDPWLAEHWLSSITEAQPLAVGLWLVPAWAIGAMAPALLGLVGILARLRFGAKAGRTDWLVLGVFLVLALAVTLIQLRGARLAALFAIPAAAWVIVQARQRYLAKADPIGIAALIFAWVGFAGVTYVGGVNVVQSLFAPQNGTMASVAVAGERAQGPLDCDQPSAFGELAALPRQSLMAPVDLGSHVLFYTGHSVVGAPYHRNEAGLIDNFRFFNQPIDEGIKILRQRGIDLVVSCRFLPEMAGLADAAPDSFVRLRAAGAVPAGFEQISSTGAVLEIYRLK